ncbi:MAG: hypothetical protein WCX69_04675 [Candidatus Paceibacterota bacterium]
MKKLLFSLVFIFSLMVGNFCFAAAAFDDNFEWWTGSVPHTIVSGDYWYYSPYTGCQVVQVSAGFGAPYEGQRMLQCQGACTKQQALRNGTASNNGFWSWYTMFENVAGSNGQQSSGFEFSQINQTAMCGKLYVYKSAAGWDIKYCDSVACANPVLITTVTSNTWHYFAINWDTSAYNASDRWVTFWVDGVTTGKIYNPMGATCTTNGIGSFEVLPYNAASSCNYGIYTYVDSIVGFGSQSGAQNGSSFSDPPQSEGCGNFTDWIVHIAQPAYDYQKLKICYGETPDNANNCDQYVDESVISACDGVNGSSLNTYKHITRGTTLVDGVTYYSKAYLIGSNQVGGVCADTVTSTIYNSFAWTDNVYGCLAEANGGQTGGFLDGLGTILSDTLSAVFEPSNGFQAAFSEANDDIATAAAAKVPFYYFTELSGSFTEMATATDDGYLFSFNIPVQVWNGHENASTTIPINAFDTSEGSGVRDVFDLIRPYINTFLWLWFAYYALTRGFRLFRPL